MFIALALVPIIEVEDRVGFALKIGGLIVVTNLIGAAIYWLAKRRSLA
jgi:hypothetical protein